MFQKAFKSLIRRHHTILNDRLSSSIRILPINYKTNEIGYVIQDRANMKQFGIDCGDNTVLEKSINQKDGEFLHLFVTNGLEYSITNYINRKNNSETMKFLNNHAGVKLTSSEESSLKNFTHPMKPGDHIDLGGLSVYMMKGLVNNPDQVMYCVFGDNQPRLFTGDIIQSCGVGLINENQYKDLFDLIYNCIFSLPQQTLIYPGKEELLRNIFFAYSIEPNNPIIKTLRDSIYFQVSENQNCPPLSIQEQQEVNPFFRLKHPNIQQNIKYTDPIDIMKELFEKRNIFDYEKAVDEFKSIIMKETQNFVSFE